MMDKLARLIEKKKIRPLDEDEKDAKLGVLGDLRDLAKGSMGDKIKGLKEVKVASDSKEGLRRGLDKAEEIMDQDPEMHDEDAPVSKASEEESDEHESEESPEQEMEEHKPFDEMSEEELDQKLQELMELKKRKGLK